VLKDRLSGYRWVRSAYLMNMFVSFLAKRFKRERKRDSVTIS